MSFPYKLHVHSIVNSQISQHNNAGDLYTYATFIIMQYPKVPTNFTLHMSKYFLDRLKQACSRGGGGATGCGATTHQSGCTHKKFAEYQRQTCWSTPPPKKKWHPTISTCCLCWTARFKKCMYMQDVLCNVIDRITQLKCWFCGRNKGAFYAPAYIQGVPRVKVTTSGECSLC